MTISFAIVRCLLLGSLVEVMSVTFDENNRAARREHNISAVLRKSDLGIDAAKRRPVVGSISERFPASVGSILAVAVDEPSVIVISDCYRRVSSEVPQQEANRNVVPDCRD